MKYYSEILNKKFDTEDELNKEEAKVLQKQEDEKNLRQKFEDAAKAVEEINQRISDLKPKEKEIIKRAKDEIHDLYKPLSDLKTEKWKEYNEAKKAYINSLADDRTPFDWMTDVFSAFRW